LRENQLGMGGTATQRTKNWGKQVVDMGNPGKKIGVKPALGGKTEEALSRGSDWERKEGKKR